MAHGPMALFRKYQKTLLAVFGVLLMVGFLVGGVVSQSARRAAQGDESNQVVVSMAGEELRESDLMNLRYSRLHLRNFMQAVNIAAAQKGATPPRTLGIPNTVAEDNLVQTSILAQQAKDLGMAVSDEAVIEFMDSYSQATLNKGEFARLLQDSTQNRMPQSQFFDAMRRELLALRYINLYQRSMLPPTPEAAWDYFERFNRRISFEAVPFSAEDYLAKVAEPTDAQVQALFEEGKERYPRPDLPTPGFRRLKQVAVQYVKAELAQFMPDAKASITDEQVQQYYDENKEVFRNISNLSSETGGTDSTDAGTSDVFPLNSDFQLGEPAATDEITPATDSATESPATQPLQDDPAEPGPKLNEAPDGQLAPVEPTEEPAAVAAETNEAATDAGLAVEDAGTTTELPVTEAETPASDSAVAETAPDAPATEDAATQEEDDPLANLPDAPGGNADTRPEFKPLEEVADDIRARLAAPLARQKMETALDSLRGPMKSYFTTFIIWERSPEKAKSPRPTPPDLRALAADKGLTVGSIPLVNPLQLHETDTVTGQPLYEISMAFDLIGGQQVVSFGQQIFDDKLDLFQVRSILGSAVDTEYLYWKTEEVAESIPKLDEVRDEVVRAFKLKQAIELAKEDAKKAAETIRQSAQRPSDVFRNDTNRTVLKADSVTWMTSGAAMGVAPQVSRIPGIRFAGDSLMKSLFRLEAGEAGVAVDQPQSNAYAIYVVTIDNDINQLRDQFYRNGPNSDTLTLAMQENQTRLVEWYQDLEKRLGVKWHRAPRMDDSGRR